MCILHFYTMYTCYMQGRASCMSYVSGFLTFMAIGGFPSFVEDMKVYKNPFLLVLCDSSLIYLHYVVILSFTYMTIHLDSSYSN